MFHFHLKAADRFPPHQGGFPFAEGFPLIFLSTHLSPFVFYTIFLTDRCTQELMRLATIQVF